MEAHSDAQMAYDAANKVHNQTESTNADLKDLLEKIRDFMIGNTTNSPDDVQKVMFIRIIIMMMAIMKMYALSAGHFCVHVYGHEQKFY